MKTLSADTIPGVGVRCFIGQDTTSLPLGCGHATGWTASATSTSSIRFSQRMAACVQARTSDLPKWKRPLDLAIILLVAPGLLFFLAVFALYIKIVSRGPVFFVQERMGRHGNPFRMLKFRTMHVDNDGGVHRQHLAELMKTNRPMAKLDSAGDKRIIPLGRLLRSSGLDELPQLINVMLGDMSVVGPRPCTRYEYDLYEPWHKERLNALPGLTGLWQVSGKNRTTFEEMIQLDIRYTRKPSFKEDLRIIAKTIPALLSQMRDQWEGRRQTAAAIPRTV